MNGNYSPVISKQMLMSCSLEVCEFCEKTFETRYDSLIHNATHIIIPLLRQNFIRCSKCLLYCTSLNNYHQHMIIKHPVVIKTERLDFWDKNYKNNHNKREEIIERDFAEQNINNDTKESKINESIILHNGVGDFTEEKSIETDFVEQNINKDTKESEINNAITLHNGLGDFTKEKSNLPITIEGNDASLKIKTEIGKKVTNNNVRSLNKPSLKDFLVFENDDILDDLSNGSIEKYQSTAEDKKSKSVSEVSDCNGVSQEYETIVDLRLDDDDDKPLISLTKCEEKTQLDELHYDVLTKPNRIFCRYCSAMFLTRFNLIIHEQKHIRFTQKISGLLCLHCDKYIAGIYTNLAKHIDAKHSKDKYKVYCTSVCKKCGLQYRSYKHHVYNYHSSKCCNLNKFITDNQFKNHLDKCLCHSHVLSVCRGCYTSLQEDVNFKCVTLGIKRTKGVLQRCKKCDNKVNEIISVKLSCKIQPKFQYWYVQDRPLSNKDRLKNIRMRLKKLNIMSKMYCFVSFFVFFSIGPNWGESQNLTN